MEGSAIKKDERALLPVVPSVEAWRRMTPTERLDFQLRVLDALSDPLITMSEGRPHKKAKSRAVDALGLHFKAIGRTVYLAEEMAVLYPGDRPFSPDVLAVLDVEEPEDDQRMSWVVAEEGKGLDLVLEVLHKGDREKDLVENVERYARLGIAEYFVYDHARQQIHGYRLSSPGATRYERIVPQLGHYRSLVLGLDVVIMNGTLRFFVGEAVLPGSLDLIQRLQGMVSSLEVRAREALTLADEARTSLARGVVAALRARSLEVSEEDCRRILDEGDVTRLSRWLERAVVATSVADILDEPRGR